MSSSSNTCIGNPTAMYSQLWHNSMDQHRNKKKLRIGIKKNTTRSGYYYYSCLLLLLLLLLLLPTTATATTLAYYWSYR